MSNLSFADHFWGPNGFDVVEKRVKVSAVQCAQAVITCFPSSHLPQLSAMSNLSFADHFWGPNGFDVVEKRLNQGTDAIKLFAYFMEERASIEERYASSLQKLLKATGNLQEFGTLRDCWLAIRGETENIAKQHQQLGQTLLKDLNQPLNKFRDDQAKMRKQYLNEAWKVQKERKDLEGKIQKSKERYDDTAKKAELNQGIADRAKTENKSQNDVVKLVAKAQKYAKEEMLFEHEYKESINKMKSFQPTWEEKTASTFRELQRQEEERIEYIKQNLLKFVEVCTPFIPESAKRLMEKVKAIDKKEDVECFIRENQTGREIPGVPSFIPYGKSGGSSSSYSSISSPSPSSPLSISSPSSSAGSNGASPTSTSPAAKFSAPGKSPSVVSRFAPKSEPAKVKVRALYDYVGADANELDFFASDIIMVIEQDDSGWWTGEVEGRKGLFPSNYVEPV
eukprot:TRINITY_DN6601_c0_g1_i1.p1 TRINITY_DN6601_c0_g1~~TRINITY_DN6601_c0_g1_i1.p1  ORF type:complete len:475 (-),score=137.49 TRINITY_DN6601_c0_g1_i1:56-1411(-)